MELSSLLENLKKKESFVKNVTYWKVIPAKEGEYFPFPEQIDGKLIRALVEKGIKNLYSHQRKAIDEVLKGNNAVVVTPTASGKTLCYNIPVINEILKNNDSRALYLFPTKALSQDQVSELLELIEGVGENIKTFTYDGDTPQDARVLIRRDGHIVVTNPDMLHTGILPHHTKWIKLFSNLKYVVIDELHTYRGVFGSHTANVIRRLKRICKFYGSNPIFILCSATISNPGDLAEKLIEEKVTVIDKSGAPTGEKNIIFYNPPVVNRQLGIRKSSIIEAKNLALEFLKKDVKTIVFAKSRLAVELILTYIREGLKENPIFKSSVKGYRGGYLPKERREIEKGLREGDIKGVVSTNALELGIDIGSLDSSIINGYPGTIASTWQQMGRAGRKTSLSCSILIASSNPLDQYIINHPDYFFEAPPEAGLINPDNIYILVSHIKCAAFELPFEEGENFGSVYVEEYLKFLEDEGILRHVDKRWYWMSEAFPAEEVSLRSASMENFVVIDTTNYTPRVIGEVDRASAPMLIHEEAIYIHDGQQYQVEKLDYEEKKAFVKKVDVDYYTDASVSTNIKVLDILKQDFINSVSKKYFGEVLVTTMATMFKKIKLFTHENVGAGPIKLPPEEMHTTAFFFTFEHKKLEPEKLQQGLLGLCNVLVNIAPLYLMCDPKDIRGVVEIKSAFTKQPTIYIFDNYPGGVGFAEKLYEIDRVLLKAAMQAILECTCDDGCPSCVGPVEDVGYYAKQSALEIVQGVLTD
ncbi:DEAD/DEAH box helicase [Thermovenabulum gondwanense]|uniref:DEAD-box ATP-dependent RNA helicase RhpA n=1 Tax=Thermovenabulum gondwanense TaxID=520767 RepID=A0A161QD74_9FIRM|nr:DEAD-box ATP-dependent RNA helicase RhpA [Thermovenabulum gondwanense]